MTVQKNYDRITFSLPRTMNEALDSLKEETKSSKSEIIKLAIEQFIKRQNEEKLKKAVEIMSKEYKENKNLTAFSSLDSEDFL